MWSDSIIGLAWLKKPPCSWKTFVAKDMATILEKIDNKNWRHVLAEYNPADLATRGLTPTDSKNCKLWWNGPEWLRLEKHLCRVLPAEFQTRKNVPVHIARSIEKEDILDRVSSLPRALHFIA